MKVIFISKNILMLNEQKLSDRMMNLMESGFFGKKVLNEQFNIDWSTKEIKPRMGSTTVLFLSPKKIYDRMATDSPDFDIRSNPSLRISDRLERAKEFLLKYGEDSNIGPEWEDYIWDAEKKDWVWGVDKSKKREQMKFEPTAVYLDTHNTNSNGEPSVNISDGRHRLLAALELGLRTFPIEIHSQDVEYFKNNFQP
jgi:hypothetical protein